MDDKIDKTSGTDDFLNSNHYNDGFVSGVRHAMEGRRKDYVKDSGSNLCKILLHGSNVTETYTQGYDEGYEWGMREKALNPDLQLPQSRKPSAIGEALNSNHEKDGWEQGLKDALAGKQKNFSRSFISSPGAFAKFMVFGRHMLDTYSNGYNSGYKQGMRQQHTHSAAHAGHSTSTQASNAINNSNNMEDFQIIDRNDFEFQSSEGGQDIELGIHSLICLYNSLVRHCINNSNILIQNINTHLGSARKAGLDIQTFNTYKKNYHLTLAQNIELFCEQVTDNDLKFIELYVEQENVRLKAATEGELYIDPEYISPQDIDTALHDQGAGSGPQSLVVQKTALNNLRAFLKEQSDQYWSIKLAYEELVESLPQCGVTIEYCQEYQNKCFDETKGLFEKVSANLGITQSYLESVINSFPS